MELILEILIITDPTLLVLDLDELLDLLDLHFFGFQGSGNDCGFAHHPVDTHVVIVSKTRLSLSLFGG